MQPVNDDMDDLFRRAAENYPLKSDSADFNKISQLLGEETVLPKKKEKKRNVLWLLLLLLIPVAFLIHYYSHNNTDKKYSSNNTLVIKETSNKIPDTNTTSANDTSATQIRPTDANNKQVAAVIKNNQPAKTQSQTNTTVNHPDKSHQLKQANSTYTTASNSRINSTKDNRENDQPIVSKSKKNNPSNTNNEISLGSSKSRKNRKAVNETLIKEDTKYLNEKIANPLPVIPTKEKVLASQEKNTIDSLHKAEPVKKRVDSSAISITKLSKNPTDTTALAKVITKNKTFTKPSLYIGIVGGLDASTVKSNKASKAGYNIGFVAGYNTGRHLRFETGILWNDKKYYSDGRNITIDKLALPQHSTIVYLNGTCGMIEIPVSIQYHFNTKGKNTWYAGTGLSSYIMKKEGYDYLYNRYNVQYYSKKEYNNSTTNWLSVWQFDIGYQVKINKAINLRIEPYARLPLHGLGIGKLPLSSIGVNAGFTLPVQ